MKWRDAPLVRQQLQEARRDWDALSASSDSPESSWPIGLAVNDAVFESPIEAVFAMWWSMFATINGEWPNQAIALDPQRRVECSGEKFRLDFAVVPRDPLIANISAVLGCQMKVAIELDGHEFHERTPQQVSVRNNRDRLLLTHGWLVFHVSGSELVRGKSMAVQPIYFAACEEYQKVRLAIAAKWNVSADVSQG